MHSEFGIHHRLESCVLCPIQLVFYSMEISYKKHDTHICNWFPETENKDRSL